MTQQRPCRTKPALFDAELDKGEGRRGESPSAIALRVAQGVIICRGCPFVRACDRARRATPNADGVYAGVYYNSHNHSKESQVRYELRYILTHKEVH